MTVLGMTEGQRLALDQLRDLVSAPGGAIQLTAGPRMANDAGGIGAEISLDCANTPAAAGGVRLRSRERFFVVIPPRFPFDMPAIYVPHSRWAGIPHVQWGFHLCLYAAPSVEWVPADGMFGLVERLTRWLERGALDELDPDDQPLHPPVAYFSSANGVMVVHPDLGELAPQASVFSRRQGRQQISAAQSQGGDTPFRLVVGITEARREDRDDVVEWISRSEWLRRQTTGELSPQQNRAPVVGAIGVLLDREMSFEYPKRAADLVANLEGLGVPREELFTAIGEVAAVNYVLASRRATGVSVVPAPLHVFVGTPSRRLADGVIRQHLVCWRVDDMGRFLAENLIFAGSADPDWADVGARAQSLLQGWIANAEISWVRVMESRPEVTVRRDLDSPAAWLLGRRVLVLGCGALGGPIADFCVRAGAAEVRVVDKDDVTPGILVRQPYTDDDVGLPKATALAARLNRIRSDNPVRPVVGQVQDTVLADGVTPPDVDLVIDATADSAIASLLERLRSPSRGTWPAVLSVVVGHHAQRGLAVIAKPGATGAGRHAFRELALASRGEYAQSLKDVADDFFPSEPRTSCSTPNPVAHRPPSPGQPHSSPLSRGTCSTQAYVLSTAADPVKPLSPRWLPSSDSTPASADQFSQGFSGWDGRTTLSVLILTVATRSGSASQPWPEYAQRCGAAPACAAPQSRLEAFFSARSTTPASASGLMTRPARPLTASFQQFTSITESKALPSSSPTTDSAAEGSPATLGCGIRIRMASHNQARRTKLLCRTS